MPEVVLVQNEPGGSERIGLDDIGFSLEIGFVDALNDMGRRNA